jgi:dihydropteroate synthase
MTSDPPSYATAAATVPRIMAILNVTPDSFSDGGEFDTVERAVARGLELRFQGADVVDVGGESTRPGAERVSASVERDRVIPVISALVAEGVVVSVDTMNAPTASAAIEAGVRYVNDVSGGLADPAMLATVARSEAHYVAMHWRGQSADMQNLARYGDVVDDVRAELGARLSAIEAAGIETERVILDPGLGFAKNAEHNWALLRHLDRLTSLGFPVLVGASRKRFLAPFGAEPAERDLATAVVSSLAAEAGAWGVRVHDVPSTVTALGVWSAWRGNTP